MSVHKNFIEGYGRNWNKLCGQKLLPYQGEIFKLFSDKFHIDAEKDGERGRKLLKSRGNKCGEICNEIHLVLGGNDVINEELKDFVNNIVNLDYNSLLEVFETLRNKYSKNKKFYLSKHLDEICFYLSKMRNISKAQTIIKEQKKNKKKEQKKEQKTEQ